MLQSFHQCSEQFEILFNKKKYDSLPAELKTVINHASSRLGRHVVEAIDRTRRTTRDAGEAGRQVLQDAGRHPAPPASGWDKIIAAKSAENPTSRRSTSR